MDLPSLGSNPINPAVLVLLVGDDRIVARLSSLQLFRTWRVERQIADELLILRPLEIEDWSR